MVSNLSSDLYQIQQRVIELYEQAECFYQISFRRPYVRLDLTGETAGQALIGKHQLRFNQVLLQENRQHFLRQTVAHEVAHLLAYDLFGPRIRAHGPKWQSVMTDAFLLPPHRCHNYDTRRSSRKQWLYRCRCKDKTIALGTTRHNRSQKGTVYLCTACRSPLTFLGHTDSAVS